MIQKIPLGTLEYIGESIKKFNLQNTIILQKEIDKFNKDKASHLKAEMNYINQK